MPELDYLVVHKERLPAEVLAAGKKLRLVQHLGLDYRGVPVETARALGVPVCAIPLVNYEAVAEHPWALLLTHYKQKTRQDQIVTDRLLLYVYCCPSLSHNISFHSAI